MRSDRYRLNPLHDPSGPPPSVPSVSAERSDMRNALLAVLLIGATTLGGCSEGVLNPKGPIASAERLILFNSLGIMLAIVIPTILATLGAAFWFRASNWRASWGDRKSTRLNS